MHVVGRAGRRRVTNRRKHLGIARAAPPRQARDLGRRSMAVLHFQLAADARQIRRVLGEERWGWRVCRVLAFSTLAAGRRHLPDAGGGQWGLVLSRVFVGHDRSCCGSRGGGGRRWQ